MGYESSHARFSDEGGQARQGNLVPFIRNNGNTDHQFDYFVSKKANGLTLPGLSRLNQPIQVFHVLRSWRPS